MKNQNRSRAVRKYLLTLGLVASAYADTVSCAQFNYADDLGIRYWQWIMSIPAADNPFTATPPGDATGAKCGVGQSGPVWFLTGTPWGGKVVRNECDFIPNGKALFFPLVNFAYFGFLSDAPETRTLEALRDSLSFCDMDSIRDVEVVVDGKRLGRKEWKHRWVKYTAERAQPFQIQLPTDNYYKFEPKDVPELILSPSVQQGLYLYLMPLPPGPHSIHWTATWDCGDPPTATTQDITYNLKVLPDVAGLIK